jgi:hypothetical protein
MFPENKLDEYFRIYDFGFIYSRISMILPGGGRVNR